MEKLEGVPLEGRYHPQGNYDIRFVRGILKEIEDGLPVRAAQVKYNLEKTTLYRWIRQYGQQGTRPVLRRDLPIQDKRTILRAIAAGNLSVKDASVAYQVSAAAIRAWQKQFARENEQLSFSNQEQLSKKKTKQQSGTNNEQVHQLQQQLAEAQLKIAALNTLIDVAEEQLKINIRKKPGGRQS